MRKEIHRVQLDEELRLRVHKLRSQELTIDVISQRLGVSRMTVKKLLRAKP